MPLISGPGLAGHRVSFIEASGRNGYRSALVDAFDRRLDNLDATEAGGEGREVAIALLHRSPGFGDHVAEGIEVALGMAGRHGCRPSVGRRQAVGGSLADGLLAEPALDEAGR